MNFELPGASLAFDGEQLIVTQTRQNLDRMRAILRNYSEVKQVEIEAKFLEVAQSNLDELGFDWGLTKYKNKQGVLVGTPELLKDGESQVYRKSDGTLTLDPTDSTDNAVVIGQATIQPIVGGVPGYETKDTVGNASLAGRSLADSFSANTSASTITIDGQTVASNSPPSLPNVTDLASGAAQLLTNSWTVTNGLDLDLAIRALSRKTGSDLMSAPKVTVLSGKRATINVGQEFRYPESYGDIESTASSSGGGSTLGGGNAAISITAGTPEDFVTRNVGVELAVTPNVENDDTISLVLEPKVTEFEGFVEYGGPSVALTGNTTVSVPAGFYQPIFSVREISTEVTVFDGATLVMGGLTRDEVKTVSDKVPVLGDIPGVGRLFRSEGETRQKRNLLIFVTANLVSPGGSLSRQSYDNAKANALFQNPTIMTPSGTANRSISDQ